MTTVEQQAKCCATCARGWPRADGSGNIGCGAPYEDRDGNKPVWSERKYSERYIILSMLNHESPPGTDCDNMDPTDGEKCKLWMQARDVVKQE